MSHRPCRRFALMTEEPARAITSAVNRRGRVKGTRFTESMPDRVSRVITFGVTPRIFAASQHFKVDPESRRDEEHGQLWRVGMKGLVRVKRFQDAWRKKRWGGGGGDSSPKRIVFWRVARRGDFRIDSRAKPASRGTFRSIGHGVPWRRRRHSESAGGIVWIRATSALSTRDRVATRIESLFNEAPAWAQSPVGRKG